MTFPAGLKRITTIIPTETINVLDINRNVEFEFILSGEEVKMKGTFYLP